jgi:hypothetical protein
MTLKRFQFLWKKIAEIFFLEKNVRANFAKFGDKNIYDCVAIGCLLSTKNV